MIGDPHTPTPAPRPRRSVSFNQDEQEGINYEKYPSPTGPRYVKTKVDPYSRTRTDPYPLDHEEDTSIMAELNRSKPIATPFPKFNPRDMEIFILEAEAWFKFNQVYEQTVRGLAPETQVDLSRYSVTIELCDSYCLGVGDYQVVQ